MPRKTQISQRKEEKALVTTIVFPAWQAFLEELAREFLSHCTVIFNDPLVVGRARCPHGRVDHEAYRGETFWAFVVSSVVWYRWCAFLFDGVAVNVLGPDLFNAA